MNYKLYIDDIRNPVSKDFVIARTSSEAINIIKERGIPEYISFDHDLGGEDTSRVVIKFLIDYVLDGGKFPDSFEFNVHSANPIGSEWIRGTMSNLLKYVFE